MATRSKAIDQYIARAEPFARPILEHFRELVHKVCPDVEETIKWSFPHYDYKGSMMCSMASFKKHCAINFWKAALMAGGEPLVEKAKTEEAMGHLGRIASLKDLPKDPELKKYIKEAMRLNDKGIRLSPKTRPARAKKELQVPDDFVKLLSKNRKALDTFENFSTSNKREYIDWIAEAKTEATRGKRMADAIEWMAEGKTRNWKYLKK